MQPFDHLLTRCKVANFGWPLPNHKLIKVNEFLLRAGLPGAPYYVILVTLPRMNLSNARCLTRVDLLLGLFSRLYQQFRKSISLLNNQTPRYRKLTHTFILFKCVLNFFKFSWPKEKPMYLMVSFKQKSQLRSIHVYHLHPLKPLQNYLNIF